MSEFPNKKLFSLMKITLKIVYVVVWYRGAYKRDSRDSVTFYCDEDDSATVANVSGPDDDYVVETLRTMIAVIIGKKKQKTNETKEKERKTTNPEKPRVHALQKRRVKKEVSFVFAFLHRANERATISTHPLSTKRRRVRDVHRANVYWLCTVVRWYRLLLHV